MFIAYLNDERAQYGHLVDHIGQFLEEAKRGECRIYCSTLALAEITKPRLARSQVGTFNDFLADFRSAVVPIDPDPTIMIRAGHLRGFEYTKTNGKRPLRTPDAIQLATAIALTEAYGVPLDALHTFDKGTNGGGVPIIGYEDWCDSFEDDEVVRKVIATKREPPAHPSPKLKV